ncbi:MAG: metal ABC transporter substrate-binding protein, partial [bacterium]|nr:metal ABC transporter substrate-binding protein [bacterium]
EEHDDHDEHEEHEEHDDHDEHDEHEGHDDHHGHDHGSEDPHIWFDPHRLSLALPELSQALAQYAGISQTALDDCTNSYIEELRNVDIEVTEILGQLPAEKRLLVTNHDALGYFADQYDFEVIGTVIPSGSTLAATNPAALQELVELVQDTGVKTIFTETTHSSQDAEALGREAGAEVATLYTGSLGPSDSGADTYIGFLRTNAQTIANGLG